MCNLLFHKIIKFEFVKLNITNLNYSRYLRTDSQSGNLSAQKLNIIESFLKI